MKKNNTMETEANDPQTKNSATSVLQQEQERQDQQGSLQKIYRQGNKIYRAPDENITMIRNFSNLNEMTPSIPDLVEVDKIKSGESLYKTFSFEHQISKEETEKCISFWRSVVQKQLEPIKCTLIENAKSRVNAGIEKTGGTGGTIRKKSTSKTGNTIENEGLRSKGKNKWYQIMEELQKKRIAQTKLLLEKKCRFCGYVNSPPYETPDPEKQNKEMIAELDQWSPKAQRQITRNNRSSNRSSGSKRKSITSDQSTTSEQKQNYTLKTHLETEDAEEMDKPIVEEKMLEEIKLASYKIKHVDVIAEKKKQGLYSKWRRNKLDTCKCDRFQCDCNINPDIKNISLDPTFSAKKKSNSSNISKSAIVSKQNIHEPHTTSVETAIDKPGKVQKEQEFLDDNLTQKPEEKSGEILKVGATSKDEQMYKEKEVTISQSISSSDIDTDYYRDEKSDEDIESHKIEVPIPKQDIQAQDDDASPKLKVLQTEERLHELYYKEALGQLSDEALLELDSEAQRKAPAVPLSIPKRSILINSEEPHMKTFESRKSARKSLSVMIACTCSYEECDCKSVIMISERTSLPIVETSTLKLPKPRSSSVRRDSLELIKRRLSSISAQSDIEGHLQEKESSLDKPKKIRSSSRSRSVDSLEIAKRRLSKFVPEKSDAEESPVEERSPLIKTRAVSITFK